MKKISFFLFTSIFFLRPLHAGEDSCQKLFELEKRIMSLRNHQMRVVLCSFNKKQGKALAKVDYAGFNQKEVKLNKKKYNRLIALNNNLATFVDRHPLKASCTKSAKLRLYKKNSLKKSLSSCKKDSSYISIELANDILRSLYLDKF